MAQFERKRRIKRRALKQVNDERRRWQESKRKARTSWVAAFRMVGLEPTNRQIDGMVDVTAEFMMGERAPKYVTALARRLQIPNGVIRKFFSYARKW